MSSTCLRKMSLSRRITDAVLLCALVFSMCLANAHDTDGAMGSNRRSGAIPVKFLYRAPRAQWVCVTGSFNQWSPQAHCMKRESGAWSITVFLPPGRYQYLFLVDGKVRQKDPGALLSQDNGFGEENSVLVVE